MFNKTIGGRVVSSNESLLYFILGTNISEDLILKLCATVSEEGLRVVLGLEELC